MDGFWKFLHDGWFLIMVFGGAAIRTAGIRIGKHRHAVQRMKLQGANPQLPKPTCGCGHDLAFHNRDTDACHGTNEGTETRMHKSTMISVPVDIRCTCQRYVGPQPLPEFFAPEISA